MTKIEMQLKSKQTMYEDFKKVVPINVFKRRLQKAIDY